MHGRVLAVTCNLKKTLSQMNCLPQAALNPGQKVLLKTCSQSNFVDDLMNHTIFITSAGLKQKREVKRS